MKLWLCVLSALLLAGCTAGTDVPGSVTPTAVPTPAATETGETAEVAATPAPTADAVQPPQGLVETGAAVLDYDDIRLLRYSRELQSYPEVEYYTMCKDGKWGFINGRGTQVIDYLLVEAGYFDANGKCPAKMDGNDTQVMLSWRVKRS